MNPNPQIPGPNGLSLEILGASVMPHSEEAERYLLAEVMADDTPRSFGICRQMGIRPKAFFIDCHRLVWRAIETLHERGVPGIELLHVREELLMTGQLEDAGGDAQLVHITAKQAGFGSVPFLAEAVKLLWDRRAMISLAAEMRENAINFEGREAFVETATDIGERLVRLGRVTAARTLKDELEMVREEVTAAAEGRIDKRTWISSGLPIFDEKCHPLTGGREDQLVVVGGGSGDGKSVLLRQFGYAALEQGCTVLAFTKETSTPGMLEMMIAARTEVDLLHPYLWRENIPAFRAECDRMIAEWADKKLFCVQHTPATPLTTVDDIEMHTRAFVNLRGAPRLILVDYLQLFGVRPKKGQRFTSGSERVEEVSHRLQGLVREMPGTTMIVACQLNEEGLKEMRLEKRDANNKLIHTLPHRGMIRDSQAIYHDADRVIFMYRPPFDCRDQDQRTSACKQPEVWLVQDKRRRGGVGAVRTWFEKRFTRFKEIGRHEAEEADNREAVRATGVVPKGGMKKSDWKKARKDNE